MVALGFASLYVHDFDSLTFRITAIQAMNVVESVKILRQRSILSLQRQTI